MMNKKNNKGFSLVELIVVVAIMAVLVGILAPAYLKYVENSRVSKDQTNAEEFVRAVEVAITDEEIYENTTITTSPLKIVITDELVMSVTEASGVYTVTNVTIENGSCGALIAEVIDSVANKLDLTSKAYKGGTLEITIDSDYKVDGELKPATP